MGQIGSFGDLVFEVSANRVRTYSEMTETAAGRWAQHESINVAPISEFLGPAQDEITLTVIFSPMLGVDPNDAYQQLRTMARTGQHEPFIVGGVPLSNAEWYIERIESTASMFSALDGSVLWRECTITLKEYN